MTDVNVGDIVGILEVLLSPTMRQLRKLGGSRRSAFGSG